MTTQQLYENLWQEHGPTHQALGWSSIGAQMTRFNVLREAITGPGEILDVGCGFGDFSVFHSDYVGIDTNHNFIQEAKRKYPTKTFWVADILELGPDKYPYVISNGVLTFQEEPIKIIQKMWDLTAKTLAFTWADTSLPDIRLALDICNCQHYSIRHDYLDRDFAVFMHRFPQ